MHVDSLWTWRSFPEASSCRLVAEDAMMAAAETVAMETTTLVTLT